MMEFASKILQKQTCRTVMIWLLLFLLPAMSGTAGKDRYMKETVWYSLEEAQKLASANDKKVLVFAEAAWCTYCNKMEREVFTDPGVIEVLKKHFYPVKLDVDSDRSLEFNGNMMTEAQFADMMNLQAVPGLLFLDAHGEALTVLTGFVAANVLEKLLVCAGPGACDETAARP